jgi:hypothetical protein
MTRIAELPVQVLPSRRAVSDSELNDEIRVPAVLRRQLRAASHSTTEHSFPAAVARPEDNPGRPREHLARGCCNSTMALSILRFEVVGKLSHRNSGNFWF